MLTTLQSGNIFDKKSYVLKNRKFFFKFGFISNLEQVQQKNVFSYNCLIFTFRPHNCPKPKYRQHAPANITKRLFDRQRSPPFGGLNGRKHNRKFIFSKFRPGPSYKGNIFLFVFDSVCVVLTFKVFRYNCEIFRKN